MLCSVSGSLELCSEQAVPHYVVREGWLLRDDSSKMCSVGPA